MAQFDFFSRRNWSRQGGTNPSVAIFKVTQGNSPASNSSSENSFVVAGFWQEKFPSVSGVRVNIISWFLCPCPRVKFWTGCLLVSGALTKKFALGSGNWFCRSLTHLNVIVLSVRPNVSTVHFANVQNKQRSRSNNNTNCAWRLLAAIACSRSKKLAGHCSPAVPRDRYSEPVICRTWGRKWQKAGRSQGVCDATILGWTKSIKPDHLSPSREVQGGLAW